MDLGTLIADLGTAYIGVCYSQPPVQSFIDVPFIDVVPEAPTGPAGAPGRGYVWNPSADCGRGKWVKRSRRRRQRLATASDIKDIASLKSVLSPAEFKVWLATH